MKTNWRDVVVCLILVVAVIFFCFQGIMRTEAGSRINVSGEVVSK